MHNGIKTGWWSCDLAHYRPQPTPQTYSLFAYEELPPITSNLDDHFGWLRSQSVKKSSLFEGGYSNGEKPDLSKVSVIASQIGLDLPVPFVTFINSPELHRRIRSCTDCYLEVGDLAVETIGSVKGYLIHFLSDSQWIWHWYLFIDFQGNHCVMTSPKPLGFDFDENFERPGISEIDVQGIDIWYCASSFTEFIYRFWIENEIWFALKSDKRPLTTLEKLYVEFYSNKRK
jgi:hypothetical protein